MKKLKNLLTLIIMASLTMSISSCKKNDPTSLELTLKDDLGNSVSSATVKLYSSQTDWNSGSNQVGATQLSDASGKVKFSDLSNINYYWFAEKDCKNNVNGAITTTSALTANINNTVNVILSNTGTIKFTNTSGDPYRIFINGTVAFDIIYGGTIQYKYYMPTGSYSLRFLQLSGYFLYPTDITYTGTIICGLTLLASFPH